MRGSEERRRRFRTAADWARERAIEQRQAREQLRASGARERLRLLAEQRLREAAGKTDDIPF